MILVIAYYVLNFLIFKYIFDLKVNNTSNPAKDESQSNGKSEPLGATSGDNTSDLLQLNDENDVKTGDKSTNDSNLDHFSLVELDDDSPAKHSSNLLNSSS